MHIKGIYKSIYKPIYKVNFTLENKLKTFKTIPNINATMKLMITKRKAFSVVKVTLIVQKAIFADWNGTICT